nr:uncharacterized protein LOC123755335 [Procambarus clarkii]
MSTQSIQKTVCEPVRDKSVEEEEDEQGKKEEDDNIEGSGGEAETRSLKTVTLVATGRSHHHGGLTRRGPPPANGVFPAKVIVTAGAKTGHLLDDTRALDRNLPPPRLTEGLLPDQSKYRKNYPGARLRVGAPRPSHLSHTHGSGVAPIRRVEPHSINFGASSLSMGAYHHPREPVIYYSAAHPVPLGGSPLVPPPHQNTHQPRPQRPHPRPQERPQSPVEKQPQKPQFRPSKLLPSTSRYTTAATLALLPPPSTLPPTSSVVRPAGPDVVGAASPRKPQQPAPRQPSDPTPSRRGLVDDAPSPAHTGDSSTASLTPLGTITKSGVRPKISHRAGAAGAGHEASPGQRGPQATNVPSRHPVTGYTRPDNSPYNFVAGDVYAPPPILQRTKPRNTQKPIARGTTRRVVDQALPVGPFQDTHSTFVPKYIKESVAEMEFEPKTVTAPQLPVYHNPNWFLMPVQGWFVLSIILAALLIVLVVVCAILYSSLKKQRKKMKKLLSTGLVLSGCVDPVNHEVCHCRALAPLVRSHTLLSEASAVSGISGRSLRQPSRHQGAVNYNNATQPRRLGFLSLPTPALQDAEKDNSQDSIITTNTQLEIEDAPPPLAPKQTSLTGTSSGEGGAGREGRLGHPESRSGRESRLGGHEARRTAYDGRYGNASRCGGEDSFGEMSGRHHQRPVGSHNPDVQLTTIYPPPTRFDL